jgi:hypothetical protein
MLVPMHARRAPGLANASNGLGASMRGVGIAACALAMTAGGLACGSSQRASLAKAGEDKDEGAGDLARASLHLSTGEGDEPESFAEAPRPQARWEQSYPYAYGGAMYGGDPYGGLAYGGTGYANWIVPQWSYSPPNRMPRYNVMANLSGAVEGTVTWLGAPPAKVTTACGPIDNPTLRVGNDKAARGVVVYIEKVVSGRAVPYYTRPVSVGGTLAKRGCALVPAAQIVVPLPGPLTVHGDEARTKLKLTRDKGAPTTQDLQEGGFVQIEAKAGITRVESEDGKLAPAWVIGLDSPYYAITDDAGRYRIDELAPGTYELTFWQAPVATTNASGTWSYGAPIVVRRSVKVGAKTSQLSVSLSGR